MSKSPPPSGKKRSSQDLMDDGEADDDVSRESSPVAPPTVKKPKADESMEVDDITQGTSPAVSPSKKHEEIMEAGDAARTPLKTAKESMKEDEEEPSTLKKAKESMEVDGSEQTPLKEPKKEDVDYDTEEEKEAKRAAARGSKKPKDEICSDADESDAQLAAAMEAANAAELAEHVQKKAAALRACRDFMKTWSDEDPFVNVELPYPSKTNREDFCWYDLSKPWREDRLPKAVSVESIDRTYGRGMAGFAQLPCTSGGKSMGTSKRARSGLILEAIGVFSRGFPDLTYLEAGIRTYWDNFRPACLKQLFKGKTPGVVAGYLKLISKIAQLALRSKYLFTRALPTLTENGSVDSVSMSQEQAACLLAYSFFCTVLPRSSDHFNHFSFHRFHAGTSPMYVQKMKFILWYFKAVTEEMPRGTLTYSRQNWNSRKDQAAGYDTWEDELVPLHVTSQGLIEEMEGCLQVDFANEFIGGGVMNHGAVQEEIRFLCCPEMLVSMFLCDRMADHEAILIQGAQQFSAYSGYMNTLKHVPMALRRDEPRDHYGRARSYLIAIDAVQFDSKGMQYQMKFITREIKKSYAGFQRLSDSSPFRPIATGNWGCGVFNGDKQMKSLIQLISASKAGRPMIYITFGDEVFAEQLQEMYALLKNHGVTNGRLFTLLTNYQRARQQKQCVFEFIGQAVQNGF